MYHLAWRFLLNLGLLILVAVFFYPFNALAADVIYVVDMQRVISESSQGKTANSNFEADQKRQQAELKVKEQELKTLQASLKAQAAVLSKSALEAKAIEFKKKVIDFRKSVAEKRQELARRNNALIEKLSNRSLEVIAKLARKNNYRFVVEKQQAGVMYIDEEYDITEQVIETLDEN